MYRSFEIGTALPAFKMHIDSRKTTAPPAVRRRRRQRYLLVFLCAAVAFITIISSSSSIHIVERCVSDKRGRAARRGVIFNWRGVGVVHPDHQNDRSRGACVLATKRDVTAGAPSLPLWVDDRWAGSRLGLGFRSARLASRYLIYCTTYMHNQQRPSA